MTVNISTKDAIAMGLIEGAAHKFNVAHASERKHNGRVYDSKAEMRYAMHLEDEQKYGRILGFAEQPRVQLGPDTVYRPDFVVIFEGRLPHPESRFVDVKGAETPEFTKIKKLWFKYMLVPLYVVRWKRGKFETSEVIP